MLVSNHFSIYLIYFFSLLYVCICYMAALDAYCLLEIFNVLADYSADLDIPFEDICAEIQHIPQTHTKTNTNKSAYKV